MYYIIGSTVLNGFIYMYYCHQNIFYTKIYNPNKQKYINVKNNQTFYLLHSLVHYIYNYN